MPQKGPQTCAIRPKKSVETSSNVPYCKAMRIRDGTPKFGRAPKISPEHVLPTKMARNDHFQKSMCAGLSRSGFTKPVGTGPVPVWASTKPAQIQNSNLNSKK